MLHVKHCVLRRHPAAAASCDSAGHCRSGIDPPCPDPRSRRGQGDDVTEIERGKNRVRLHPAARVDISTVSARTCATLRRTTAAGRRESRDLARRAWRMFHVNPSNRIRGSRRAAGRSEAGRLPEASRRGGTTGPADGAALPSPRIGRRRDPAERQFPGAPGERVESPRGGNQIGLRRVAHAGCFT